MEQLEASCAECASENINRQSFSCLEESPSFLTYRARLEGTSDTDSGSLIPLIEDWVRGGGASVIVAGVLMTVDSQCSVTISSPGEPQCSPPTTASPTPRITSNFTISSTQSCACTENTPAIIGGAVAIVIALITAATIIAIVALILKNRPHTIKKTSMEGTAIPTATNTAYGTTKRKPVGIGGAPTISPSSDIELIEEEKMYEMMPSERML